MGSFSIFHLVILLLIITLPIWLIVRANKKHARSPGEKLAGFGGWLALLAFGQTLEPVMTMLAIVNLLEGPTDYVGLVLGVTFLLYQIYTTVQMYRARRSFRWLFAIKNGVTLIFVGLLGISLVQGRSSGGAVGLILTGVGLIAWTLYAFLSRRVANTFIEPRSARDDVAVFS